MDENDKIELNLNEFPCEEYLHEDYSLGLFHPTEPMFLLSNGEPKISSSGNYLIIGYVCDDRDFTICYRKSEPGVWGLDKRIGKYHLLGKTLKELVEGWYPTVERFYWELMDSKTQWQEIMAYYTRNQVKYGWKTQVFMDFIQECVALQLPDRFYIKASQGDFSISSENGFHSRAQKNMVWVYLDYGTEDYGISYNLNFFKEHSRKVFPKSEIREAIASIVEWIDRKNEE